MYAFHNTLSYPLKIKCFYFWIVSLKMKCRLKWKQLYLYFFMHFSYFTISSLTNKTTLHKISRRFPNISYLMRRSPEGLTYKVLLISTQFIQKYLMCVETRKRRTQKERNIRSQSYIRRMTQWDLFYPTDMRCYLYAL